MEPQTHNKRETSAYIPYRFTDGEVAFYLQKRDAHAKRSPNLFGMFGGGLESNETPQEALMREVQEELTYVPQAPRYFSRYETAYLIFHVFIEEVGNDFESHVKVEEGEYGKFLTTEEISTLPNMSLLTRLVTVQIRESLSK